MTLFWKTRFFLWLDQVKTIFYFYRKWRFALSDFLLGCLYFFSNPFRICRRFLQKKGEERVYAYGETPLSVWKEIALLAQIGKEDLFIDLGCGRGKICFWTASWIGCRTIGVDWVPSFIKRASFLARLLGFPSLQFFQASISQIPLGEASVLYLYTFHPEEELLDISLLTSSSRVITVSEPLSDPRFRVSASRYVSFPWGDTEVFINHCLY